MLLLILLHNNHDDDSIFGSGTNTTNKKLLLFIIMPTQKNNSCRMGGPEKGWWVTKILIRASTGVCINHNHLPSEMFLRSNFQTLKKLFLSSSLPDSKETNINLLD